MMVQRLRLDGYAYLSKFATKEPLKPLALQGVTIEAQLGALWGSSPRVAITRVLVSSGDVRFFSCIAPMQPCLLILVFHSLGPLCGLVT